MKNNFGKEVEWLLKGKYSGKPTENFEKDVERLKKGEPLDYVIGFSEFLGCKIDLSQKPLIPRPETEFWVEIAIQETSRLFHTCEKDGKTKLKILDMFAGSGCVGIAILKHIKNSEIVFADNDKKALKQIKINLKLNIISKSNEEKHSDILQSVRMFLAGGGEKTYSNVLENIGINKIEKYKHKHRNQHKYKIVRSDVFGNIKGKFDYIFANPPYIPNNQKTRNKIQKSVLKYEPRGALFGGKDGLFYIKKFLEQAKSHLNSGGRIFMEFDPPQKKEIEKILKRYGCKNWGFHRDQYGRRRWLDLYIDNMVSSSILKK